MSAIRCPKCGKETLYGESRPRFCSACGQPFESECRSSDSRAFLNRARAEEDAAAKYALLTEARGKFPNDYEIEMEILCLGRLYERGGRADFYRIPYWPLNALERPKEFSEKERKKMLSAFFENPDLRRVMALAKDEAAFWNDYMRRMAREYVALFIASNNANTLLLGFRRRETDRMKRCAASLTGMLIHTEESPLVPEAARAPLLNGLWDAFLQQFPDERAGGYLREMTKGRVKFRNDGDTRLPNERESG